MELSSEEVSLLQMGCSRLSTDYITQPSSYAMRLEIKTTFYLVKARPRMDLLENLRDELSSGEISKMRPFGRSLQYSLENARIDTVDSNFALWVEEDYCSPLLAMEREAVLNQYFNDIIVEKVESEKEAWSRLKDKLRLWSKR